MKSVALIILSILILSGCGKKTTSAEGKKLAAISAQLNGRDYEGAIEALEELQKENSDPSIKIKLAHAYAGASGYETINFSLTLDKVSHTKTKGWERKTAKEVLELVVRAMDPIPTLSSKQKRRLDQSIDLYKELGFSPYTATKEVNFKWGVLHTYRLLTTLKSLIITFKSVAFEEIQVSNEELEKLTIEAFTAMGKDFFDSYLLYVNSYDKLKNTASKFEEMLQKLNNVQDLKIQLSVNAKDHAEFINDFFTMNTKFTAILVRKAIKLFEVGDYQTAIKEMINQDIPSQERVLSSERKIAILLETFLQSTMTDHPIIDYTIKKVFTPELEAEVKKAVKLSMKKGNAQPLKDLYASKSVEMTLVRGCYDIFVKEGKDQEIDQPISEELVMLRKYINDEEIKRKTEIMGQDALADSEVLQNGVEAILPQEQKLLEEEKKRLDEDEKKLDEDQKNYEKEAQQVKDSVDDFTEELKVDHESEEYQDARKIVKKVDSQTRR